MQNSANGMNGVHASIIVWYSNNSIQYQDRILLKVYAMNLHCI